MTQTTSDFCECGYQKNFVGILSAHVLWGVVLSCAPIDPPELPNTIRVCVCVISITSKAFLVTKQLFIAYADGEAVLNTEYIKD